MKYGIELLKFQLNKLRFQLNKLSLLIPYHSTVCVSIYKNTVLHFLIFPHVPYINAIIALFTNNLYLQSIISIDNSLFNDISESKDYIKEGFFLYLLKI